MSGSARVDPNTRIAVRHPFFRVDEFPVLVLIARSLQDLGRRLDQASPIAFVALLKGESFCVGPITQYDGILAFAGGPKNVGPQDDAVVHQNRSVPIDVHSVSLFAPHLQHAKIPTCTFRETTLLWAMTPHRVRVGGIHTHIDSPLPFSF